ncbi:FkbM family methyltransferase [Pelagibacteraceae bacterium]|jgi:FkbM family methyltransferase|nr:FkbM family methyltransferase [Pelagibacteraceae bacterium]
MSLALKRSAPNLYKFLKKFERYVPASTSLWDKKKYTLNLQIISMLNIWKSWPRLKREAEIVFNFYNGGDFIDIGAAQGFYSFLLAPKAKLNDTFVQCEPNPDERKDLMNNLKVLNKLFNSIKLEFIFTPIGNGKSVSRQPTNYGHPVYSSEIKNNSEDKIIESFKIDDLLKKYSLNPNFIKIDVEGAEFEVLQGAKNTLKNYKPLIMLEKHPTLIPKNISLNTIDNFLNEAGYKRECLVFQDDIAINEIWGKKN